MPSSFKTELLELNRWRAEDRPTRSDFISDNLIIDEKLGTHLSDSGAHLTEEEKIRIGSPYSFRTVQGNDESSRTVTFDFEPQAVIMFAVDEPLVETKNGTLYVNSCIAVRGYGGTKNCSIGSGGLKVFQKTEGSVVYNFNSSDCQYIIVAFR